MKSNFDQVKYVITQMGGRLLTKKEEDEMFTGLKDFTPEAPKEMEEFKPYEPFKYEGPVDVVEARFYVVSGSEATEYYKEGMRLVQFSTVVQEGEFKGRQLNRKFDIDDENKQQLLANHLKPFGIELTETSDEETLKPYLIKIKGTVREVNAYHFAGKNDDPNKPGKKERIQMWFFKEQSLDLSNPKY